MKNIIGEEIDKHIKKAVALCLMSAVGTVSVCSAGIFSRRVYVNVDHNTVSAITINTDTYKILDQVGVKVNSEDMVDRSDDIDGSIKINVTRALDVSVVKGEQEVRLKIAGGTVADAVKQSGITLGERDETDIPAESALEDGMKIFVRERIKIKLTADGETSEYFVPSGSVMNAVEYLHKELSSEDIINADALSDVYEGMELIINRIVGREVTKTVDIPFSTVVKKAGLLSSGVREVSTQGKNGSKEVKCRETLKDGEVIKSEELESKVICKPVDEVILEGTGSGGAQITKSGSKSNASSYSSKKCSKVIEGYATAYFALPGSTTSTGENPIPGVTVAVNPAIIPYGTRVKIESVDGKFKRYGIAQDTGGAMLSGRIAADILMSSVSECNRFGRQKVKISY